MNNLLVPVVGLAFTLAASAARAEMKSAPNWDLRRDAGSISERLARDGYVPLDAAHAFDIPQEVITDPQAFTVKIEFTCTNGEQTRRLDLLRQKTATTGWSLSASIWNQAGNPVELGVNEAIHSVARFNPKLGQRQSLVLTARRGLLVVYQDGQPVSRYFARIIPNLEPVHVGPSASNDLKKSVPEMEGVRLHALRFWGPDEEYYAPGESRDFAEGMRGGKGWLMSCPSEDPQIPLPRILCYGDSILRGYGPILREKLKGKAYVYIWSGFIASASGMDLWKKPFDEACRVAKFDAIVFNNGLHSLHWTEDKVSDELIRQTQGTICSAFRRGAPTAEIWWLATTPHTSRERDAKGQVFAFGNRNPIVERINRLTSEEMKAQNVREIDVYGLLSKHLDLACGDEYHWTATGYEMIADAVIAAVLPNVK